MGKESIEKKEDRKDSSMEETDLLGKPLKIVYGPDSPEAPDGTEALYWGDTLIKKKFRNSPGEDLNEVFEFLKKEQVDLDETTYTRVVDIMDKTEERAVVKDVLKKLDSEEAETLEKILPIGYLPEDSERVKEYEKETRQEMEKNRELLEKEKEE